MPARPGADIIATTGFANAHPNQSSGREFTVAIMQPYFVPYAGYFRLIESADLFVIYDCVQFQRRGWTHRNKLTDANGVEDWITLPLQKAPQSVLIKDLQFVDNASEILAERLRRFVLPARDPSLNATVLDVILRTDGSVVDYLAATLEHVATYLGFRCSVIRSSSLALPAELRGQDRIIEIARRLGARRYVNAPGGRDLYDDEAFRAAGMKLEFLPSYAGPSASILSRMLGEDRERLHEDICNYPHGVAG